VQQDKCQPTASGMSTTQQHRSVLQKNKKWLTVVLGADQSCGACDAYVGIKGTDQHADLVLLIIDFLLQY